MWACHPEAPVLAAPPSNNAQEEGGEGRGTAVSTGLMATAEGAGEGRLGRGRSTLALEVAPCWLFCRGPGNMFYVSSA